MTLQHGRERKGIANPIKFYQRKYDNGKRKLVWYFGMVLPAGSVIIMRLLANIERALF